jgi:hypothetical protein
MSCNWCGPGNRTASGHCTRMRSTNSNWRAWLADLLRRIAVIRPPSLGSRASRWRCAEIVAERREGRPALCYFCRSRARRRRARKNTLHSPSPSILLPFAESPKGGLTATTPLGPTNRFWVNSLPKIIVALRGTMPLTMTGASKIPLNNLADQLLAGSSLPARPADALEHVRMIFWPYPRHALADKRVKRGRRDRYGLLQRLLRLVGSM